jgi:hypothetical protein
MISGFSKFKEYGFVVQMAVYILGLPYFVERLVDPAMIKSSRSLSA